METGILGGKNANFGKARRRYQVCRFFNRYGSIATYEVVVLPTLAYLPGDVEVEQVAAIIEPVPHLKHDTAPISVYEKRWRP